MQRRIFIVLAALFAFSLEGRALAQYYSTEALGFGGLSTNVSRPIGFGGLNVGGAAGMDATPGVRLSDSMLLHAGVNLGAGVDSNIFFQDTGRTSAAMTRVMPHLALTNEGRGFTPNTTFNLAVHSDYRQYFSDSATLGQQGAAFGIGGAGILTFGARSPVSASIFANAVRDVQASYQPGSLEFARDFVQPGARLRWVPGGGRLEELLTYTFHYDHFENGNLFLADNIGHFIDFRSSFRFLPKTAIYINVNQGFIHYLNSNTGKNDSKPFRARAGLLGLLTAKTALELFAGYGNGFYEGGPSPSSFLAGASIGWTIGPFLTSKIGYEHNFNNSVFGNYYDLDAAYAMLGQRFGNYVMTGLSARFEHREYHCPPGGDTAAVVCVQDVTGENRTDNWLAVGPNISIYPRPWFAIGASYQLLTNLTDFTLPGPNPAKVSFVKHQVIGTLSVTY